MGLSAVCRWVDTQLEPPNRRYCLGFWDVPSNKRQVRFVSGLVGQLCRLNHALLRFSFFIFEMILSKRLMCLFLDST